MAEVTRIAARIVPGVKTSRDEFLVAIDRESLETRLQAYFDGKISHSDLGSRYPNVMAVSDRYDPISTRDVLLRRGPLPKNIVRYTYRPFDVRWLYWEPETKLLDEKRTEYWPHVVVDNTFIEARERQPAEEFDRGTIVHGLADNFGNGLSSFFPLYLYERSGKGHSLTPNLSKSLLTYLQARDLPPETIFRHVTAIVHAPSYRVENAGALRMDWPRVPIPNKATACAASADLGMALAVLLNVETPAPGVSQGKLRPGLRALGLPYKRNGKPLSDNDLSVTAGWGHVQISKTGSMLVMPGSGLADKREYTNAESVALTEEARALGISADVVFQLLGQHTLDIHLNADTMWVNVPEKVWDYGLGGHQVFKKWLSYREKVILRRALKPDEVAYASEMVRRIAAILLLGPSLDANYEKSKADALEWSEGRPVVN